MRQTPLPAHHLSVPSALEYMAARLLSLPPAPLRFFRRLSRLSTLSVLVMVGISIWLLEVHSSLLEVGDWPCSLNPSSWHRAWARALRNVLRRDKEEAAPLTMNPGSASLPKGHHSRAQDHSGRRPPAQIPVPPELKEKSSQQPASPPRASGTSSCSGVLGVGGHIDDQGKG